jgi:hypothetical protein
MAAEDEFFGRIAAYYQVRGWDRPGTAAQFEEAAACCWDLRLVTGGDGERYFVLPDLGDPPDRGVA